jgi:hypothetical protein
MNGAWYSPDEIIPSISITIESPERYAGKKIEIGLIPVDPSDDHLFDEIKGLVGERVSLDLPEPVRETTYQIPPKTLNLTKEPNQTAGDNSGQRDAPTSASHP